MYSHKRKSPWLRDNTWGEYLFSSCLCPFRINRHALPRSRFLLKLDKAIDFGKQCIISAATDIEAWYDMPSPLADDDRATVDGLAIEALHAQSLGMAISIVGAAATALMMCHLSISFSLRPMPGCHQCGDAYIPGGDQPSVDSVAWHGI